MSTRKSLVYSFLDRYSGLAISVVSSMVIARLLTPTEIGVFSVVMVLLMFVSTVRDMGTGQYLVQEKELTTARIRSVWAVQLGLGFGLALVVLLASYPVSVFYREPRMLSIMFVVALNYAVNPFGSLTYAWLMREMQFKRIAVMRFTSALGGAIVSVWLAFGGHGPISLAFGSLAATSVNAFMAIFFRPAVFPWIPGIAEIRRVLSFGSKLTASSIMTVLSTNAPELFLGKLQSLTAAGLFSRSTGLVQMFHRLFVEAVGAVCLPWFSKQSREVGDFQAPFVKATAYVTAFGWSFCIVIVCLAHPLVRVLYGEQWDDSVNPARLLAIAAAFSIPASLCQVALLSVGAVARIARVAILNALQTVVLVFIGAWFGLEALGISMIISSFISATLWFWHTTRQLKLPPSRLLGMLRASAVTAICVGFVPVIILILLGPRPEQSLTALLIGFAGASIGFIFGVWISNHPLTEEGRSILSRLRRSEQRDA